MIPSLAGKLLRMDGYAKTSLLLLILASILYTLSLITHSWFELPGIAWYGPWWAKFCDNLGECHYIPAFFTKEPVFYHILQLMCVFSVAAINGAIYLLLVEKAELKISRYFRKTKGQSIAMVCFMSAFAVSGSLYLFYHIIDDFPREAGIYPEMHWAAMLASLFLWAPVHGRTIHAELLTRTLRAFSAIHQISQWLQIDFWAKEWLQIDTLG